MVKQEVPKQQPAKQVVAQKIPEQPKFEIEVTTATPQFLGKLGGVENVTALAEEDVLSNDIQNQINNSTQQSASELQLKIRQLKEQKLVELVRNQEVQ